MARLNLDDTERRMFQHAADGYGAVVTGGDASDRADALRDALDTPILEVDCQDINTSEEFIKAVRSRAADTTQEGLDGLESIRSTHLLRTVDETDQTLLLLEFDAMPADTQTEVARMLKHVAEKAEAWTGSIGFACADGDSVTRAEPDLRIRVRTWQLE